ncbi:MAG: hypothetical protein ACOCP4_04225 [Candidatus Woesearchaeota archaeon]
MAIIMGSCQVTKKKTIVSTEGKSSTLNFKPENRDLTIKNGVTVSINPISADTVNPYFKYLSRQSGKYESSNISTYVEEFIKRKGADEDSQEMSLMYKILKAAEKYCNKNDIPTKIKDLLIQDIIKTYGPRNYANESKKEFIVNPYFINGKYLSLFDLEFYNASDKKVTIDINELDVFADNSRLQIYTKDLLKSYLSNLNDKLLIDRCNFPDSLTIYPGDSVSTLVATSPIKSKDQVLNVYISGKKAKFETEYIINEISDEIVLNHLETDKYRGENIFAVYENNKGEYHKLLDKDYDILLPEIQSVKTIHVIVHKKERNKFYMEHKFNIDPSELKKENGTYDELDLPEVEKLKLLN